MIPRTKSWALPTSSTTTMMLVQPGGVCPRNHSTVE